jgi:hypothetical protein
MAPTAYHVQVSSRVGIWKIRSSTFCEALNGTRDETTCPDRWDKSAFNQRLPQFLTSGAKRSLRRGCNPSFRVDSGQLGSYLVVNNCGEPAPRWTLAGVCTSFALRQYRSKCSPPGTIGTEKADRDCDRLPSLGRRIPVAMPTPKEHPSFVLNR